MVDDDPEFPPDSLEPLAGPPAWVKVVAALIAALLLLFAILTMTGGTASRGPERTDSESRTGV